MINKMYIDKYVEYYHNNLYESYYTESLYFWKGSEKCVRKK